MTLSKNQLESEIAELQHNREYEQKDSPDCTTHAIDFMLEMQIDILNKIKSKYFENQQLTEMEKLKRRLTRLQNSLKKENQYSNKYHKIKDEIYRIEETLENSLKNSQPPLKNEISSE